MDRNKPAKVRYNGFIIAAQFIFLYKVPLWVPSTWSLRYSTGSEREIMTLILKEPDTDRSANLDILFYLIQRTVQINISR